jgi:hypothetical protein
MTRGLSPGEDAELETLRARLHELMTISSPPEAAGGDELRRVHQRVKELLEKAEARLQLRVQWHPSKPHGWEACEGKIRTSLSADAARMGCEDPPVVVRIDQVNGAWRCTGVWSNNSPCPAAVTTVDLALGLCGLRAG